MLTGISKPLIFVVISALVVASIYSSFSTSGVFALPPDFNWGKSGECFRVEDDVRNTRCCWTEPDILNPGGPTITWCQTCDASNPPATDCGPVFIETPSPMGPIAPPQGGVLEEPPTPPSGPAAPLQDGVLEQPPTPPPGPAAPLQDGGVLQQPPTQGVAPPVTRGQGVLPEDGVLQQPPADEGTTELPPPPATEETQPATAEEEQPVPVCQEGLEFNEGLGFCVPEDCPEGQVLDEETGICVLEEQPAAAEEPEEQQQTEEEQPSEESDSEGDNSNN